ncbi:MAG: efflux RND transporter periplasmic adaptor subunit [Arenimonas sp.]|nr:efflux RND transporter periplasmic adaptor subunit [Arenimonas sp.]
MRLAPIALLLLLTACGGDDAGRKKDAGPPATVTVVTLAPEPWRDSIDAVGTVKARNSVVIAAKQSERIAAVRFESGQRVAKGQMLVELDAGTVRAELAEARATLVDLDAQVARLRDLQGRQLVARSQLDTAVAGRNAAAARVQAAQVRLDERVIRAPFGGVLGLRLVSEGQFVNAGAAMVNLDDLERMWVDFPVPENRIAELETGMTLELAADAYPQRTFRARLAGIDSRVDIDTRAVMARAEIADSEGLVRPGMLVRVSLQREAADALVVPELALQQVGNRTFVYLAAADGTAVSRDVTVGGRRDGKALVLNGLKAGERVVLDGTSKLRDGQKIAVAPAAAKVAP